MHDGPRSDTAVAADDERERVAAVLEQLRAGVRQRQAEATTLGAGAALGAAGAGERLGSAALARLLQLRESEYVREPVPTSPRPGLGRWIVLARKAGYKLFGKWLVRPLLEQQNAFNQAVAAALQELLESEARLRRQVRELEARLEARQADERPGSGEA